MFFPNLIEILIFKNKETVSTADKQYGSCDGERIRGEAQEKAVIECHSSVCHEASYRLRKGGRFPGIENRKNKEQASKGHKSKDLQWIWWIKSGLAGLQQKRGCDAKHATLQEKKQLTYRNGQNGER